MDGRLRLRCLGRRKRQCWLRRRQR